MKNLLIYVNPSHSFNAESERLIKVQIDNAARLGGLKDLMVVTNFDFRYLGVNSIVVSDDTFCQVHDKASKINVILELFSVGMISENELYWFHDLDAYLINTFTEKNIRDVLQDSPIGLTTYGWSPKWNTGSFFFTKKALPIFEEIKEAVYRLETDEERALVYLMKKRVDNIEKNHKVMDITYNIGMRKVAENVSQAEKPIKVLHFHPTKELLRSFQPLLPKKLIIIFQRHGFC